MSGYPEIYDLTYSYTAFQQSQGDNSFPGTFLDDDLAGLHDSIASFATFVQGVMRSDGALQNGVVTKESLSSELHLGLATPTVWAAATVYALDDTVTEGAVLYICLGAHTSSTDFPTDLASGLWRELATFVTPSVLPSGSVGATQLVDGSVSTAKLADAAVTAPKIADGSVTAAKAAVSLGVLPVGALVPYAGISLPSGFLWPDGTAYSRTGTYAALFAALTLSVSATAVSGNPALMVSTDLRGRGLVGSKVESAAFPAGTTVLSISATSVTLSANATSGGATSVRFFPHGNGDGSSTFNVPDKRGRSEISRDDLGGTAASRFSGGGLGVGAGEETHTLTSSELAVHSHGITDVGHTHGVTDPGHHHSYTPPAATIAGAGAGAVASPGSSTSTGNSTTGITVNSGATGISVNSAGSGAAHNNVHPVLVCNSILFAGV